MRFITTASGVSDGVKLWCQKAEKAGERDKWFIHKLPDFFLPVNDEVIDAQASGAVRRDGDDMILLRGSLKGREVVLETGDPIDHSRIMVLGHIDREFARFNAEAPAPIDPHVSVIGPNLYVGRLVEARHINRKAGKPEGHEEFWFLAVMEDGHHVDAKLMFYPSADARQLLEPWVEGTVVSCRDGKVFYHQVDARPLSRRFERAAA